MGANAYLFPTRMDAIGIARGTQIDYDTKQALPVSMAAIIYDLHACACQTYYALLLPVLILSRYLSAIRMELMHREARKWFTMIRHAISGPTPIVLLIVRVGSTSRTSISPSAILRYSG